MPLEGDDQQPSNQFSMQTAPIQQPDITPEATPPQLRFVRPEAGNPGAGMMDLARSLQNLDSGIGSYLDARQKQQDQYDAIKGEADFHKNNATGYQQAVQQGLIPAQSSQAYVSAYKQAQGSVAGQDLQQKYDAAYDAWGGKSSDDPDAYQKFVQGFIAQNVSTDDPDVLKGLMPKITQIANQGQQRYIQDKHTMTVEGSVDAHVAMVDNAITQVQQDAIKNGTPMDVTKGGAFINAIRTAYLNSGGTPEQFDNKFIDTITTKALMARGTMGMDTLKLLDQNVPGTDHTYAQTEYGASKLLHATDTLEQWQRRDIADAAKKTNDANSAALDDVTTRTLNSLAANPGQPIPDSLIAEGTKYDPKFRVNALGWSDTMAKAAGTSDPEAILNLNWSIANGGGVQAIAQAQQNGVFHNASELRDALKLNEQTIANISKMAPVMASEPVKAILGSLHDILVKKDALGVVTGDVVGGAQRYLGASYSLQRQISDWVTANPNANEQQTQEAVAKIGAGLLGSLTSNGMDTGINQPASAPSNPYLKPGQNGVAAPTQDQRQAAQQQPQQQPQQAPQAAQPPAPDTEQSRIAKAVAPAVPPAQPDPKAVQAWFQSLPPAQQKQITDWGTKAVMTPANAAAKFYSIQQAKGAATAATGPAVPTTQPQPQQQQQAPAPTDLQKQVGDAFHAWKESDPNSPQIIHQLETSFMGALHNQGSYQGNYTVAAIKDNPKAAHILDFVSGPESRGNYNAYYEHGGSTNDLSKMTLNQIMQWQKQRTDAGSASSATGRYQFMHDTLATIKTQMGLTGSEKFTPELQDNMAIQLLKNRGYDRWVKGEMSDQTFANNLAHEWASLPDVHTGRSIYSGDGLNKSLVTPHQVLGALGTAKTLAGQTAETTATASQ